MKQLAQASGVTTASSQTVFRLWSDVQAWPTWDKEIDWVKLNGAFAAGTHGVMKPKGGPKTKFMILAVKQDESFSDVSFMPGAKLRFSHQLTSQGKSTTVTHTVSISGPLSGLWSKILGKNLRSGLQPAVNNLVALAEQTA